MTTKHTHQVVFGRKVAGCPRCDELVNGAKPVKWKLSNDQQRLLDIRAHFNSDYHRSGKCGPVCTYGD